MWKHFFLKENIKFRVLFSIILSLYIVTFVYFLEPLKNNTIHYNYPFYYNILAAIACFISISFFSLIIPLFFPRFFSPAKWTFNRFIIWFLGTCISTAYASYLFDAWAYQLPNTSSVIFEYVFSYQIFIDIFISISLFLFFLYPYPLNQQSKHIDIIAELELTNAHSIIKEIINTETDSITQSQRLNFQSKPNNIEILIEHLYYIVSANNYVEIFYKKDQGHLNRLLLRSTLKNIEEQNQDLPMLFRCHKAYIVNSQKIKSINGNTKGYSLILENTDESIPVSRQKNEELEKRFPHLL
jgi:hypothetical protein